MNKKGQVWSIDLIVGLLIFVLVIVIFYSLLGENKESKIVSYTKSADITTERLFDEGLVDENTGEFNETIFSELSEMNYDELKESLGISGDFCLFIETTDDPPKLLMINNLTGLGSSDFTISGYPCGEEILSP
ncbi:hypothetical protein CMO90_03805 [Candidatus Woesearchaeota archaeon]|jgi:hypothetical protein|nr:hypothetical protein [Candidatus Woesearchaeota archaeon]|tara:strand:+ start:411 stop:809 length:399 start_codon:yes stop_codon:yes gene_type:complete